MKYTPLNYVFNNNVPPNRIIHPNHRLYRNNKNKIQLNWRQKIQKKKNTEAKLIDESHTQAENWRNKLQYGLFITANTKILPNSQHNFWCKFPIDNNRIPLLCFTNFVVDFPLFIRSSLNGVIEFWMKTKMIMTQRDFRAHTYTPRMKRIKERETTNEKKIYLHMHHISTVESKGRTEKERNGKLRTYTQYECDWVWIGVSFTVSLQYESLSVCMVYVRACVCVCLICCDRQRKSIRIHRMAKNTAIIHICTCGTSTMLCVGLQVTVCARKVDWLQ